jgi:glycosyltransferase involved in cell wall biosynthesis
MKTISMVTPCYNEENNVREVYGRVRDAIVAAGEYRYEHIFIDNASTDNTLGVLKEMAAADKNVKVIRNTRNFGQIRSPMHALHQATGDAIIGIVADLQDPPEMITDMIRHWEAGTPVVIAVKQSAGESGLMFWLRKRYYRLVNRLSGVETYENFTGFGLYDRKVLEEVKRYEDPYPYFRGIIAELGFPRVELPYHQPARQRGITKNNWYSLYDFAMLGITSLSKVPLRMAVFAGFAGSVLSVLISLAYFIYKLVFWDGFSVGVAPLVIGGFFFSSLQLFFLGLLGEYLGAVHTMIQKRPFAIEQERINFEYPPGEPLARPLVSQESSCAL